MLAITRKIKPAYVGIGSAIALLLLLVPTGNMSLQDVYGFINWNVLAIYWGFLMLAIVFSKSGVPIKIARFLLRKSRNEGAALFILCSLTAFISSFMENVATVMLMIPIAMETAKLSKSSLFPYLVSIAISSNMVTTITMISDSPTLILAGSTGMRFTDFYLFRGNLGLGTISVFGVIVGLSALALTNFRKMKKRVVLREKSIEVAYLPAVLFVAAIISLALLPPLGIMSGWIGIGSGILAILAGRKFIRKIIREFDWNSFFFIVGIFIVVGTVNYVGLLQDLAGFFVGLGLGNPNLILAIITWTSVALSSFIDNVPYTMMMIPVCTTIAESIGISPFPILFGMLIGTGIGGNVLPVGAAANVFACGVLEKKGYKIRLREYLRFSLPASVAAVGTGHLLLQLLWL